MREFMSWKFSINRPNVRQALECASPLALWAAARSDRAAEGRRTPRRYRANREFFRLMIPIRNSGIVVPLVRRVLRADGYGMKSHSASAPVPPEPLQPVRHGKIERMNTRRHGLNRRQRREGRKKFPIFFASFSSVKVFAFSAQAALSKATETRRPKGFKISCNVARVGLPFLDRIL